METTPVSPVRGKAKSFRELSKDNSDDIDYLNRFQAFLAALTRLSKEYQIIILSCDDGGMCIADIKESGGYTRYTSDSLEDDCVLQFYYVIREKE